MATSSDTEKLLVDGDQDVEPSSVADDELCGTAKQDYIDEEGALVVAKGETLRITQQSADGRLFVVESIRSGRVSKVPTDLIHIVDYDLIVPQVSDKKGSQYQGSSLKRRPALDRNRQRPVSLRSRAELVSSMPLDDDNHPLIDSGDDEPTQGTRPSRRLAFEKGSINRPVSKERTELVESTPSFGNIYTDDHPLIDLDVLPQSHPRSVYFPMTSAVKQVVVAPSTAVCSDISEPAHSPMDSSGLLISQGFPSDQPEEFRTIEKLNIISVSGVDREGRPVIVVSAVRLPPSGEINHQTLLQYGLTALDQYAESDYTLVYFHYGLTSKNKPGYNLLIQMYSHLDKKYKKNLKKLYIVHPTTFIKTMYHILKPLFSYKFGKKLTYINRLEELSPVIFLNQIDIPSEVRMYDLTLSPSSGIPKSVFYDAYAATSPETRQFGVSLEVLKSRNHDIPIPIVMETCISYLKNHGGLDKVGIFRRSPSALVVQEIKTRFNEGQAVNLEEYNDPHIAATLLKLFLRELPEPLVTMNTNERICELEGLSSETKLQKCQEIVNALPSLNHEVLHYLLLFVKDVVSRSELNKMTEMNMAIVLGPNLIWSLEVTTLSDIVHINTFTYLLIKHTDTIFN